MSDSPHLTEISPLAVPPDAGVVVLFGGSFDPVTLAHTRLAMRARKVAEPGAWLVLVPAACSPHKRAGPIASDAERVEMLRLAACDIERCAVWTDEIVRGGTSYSIDTIVRARAVLDRDVRLRLLIGADQALSFHRWREFRQILELATPMVIPRDGLACRDDLVSAMAGEWSRLEQERWGSWLVEMDQMEASATSVREMVRRGEFEKLVGVLHPLVLEVVKERGLYR